MLQWWNFLQRIPRSGSWSGGLQNVMVSSLSTHRSGKMFTKIWSVVFMWNCSETNKQTNDRCKTPSLVEVTKTSFNTKCNLKDKDAHCKCPKFHTLTDPVFVERNKWSCTAVYCIHDPYNTDVLFVLCIVLYSRVCPLHCTVFTRYITLTFCLFFALYCIHELYNTDVLFVLCIVLYSRAI